MQVTPYYERGGTLVYQGEALAVLRELPDASVDAVVTDPPYSSGGLFRGDRAASTTTKYVQSEQAGKRPDFDGDNRDQRAYLTWCSLWLSECLRIAKPGALLAMFTDWRQYPVTADAFQCGGWVWRGVVVWDKTDGARPQKRRFTAQAEFVLWGSAGAMPDPTPDAPCPSGVFHQMIRQADKFHIAGKPTALMRHLLGIVPAGGVVLDPFMGSGTTLLAAQGLGLSAIGVEMQAHNCETAVRRLEHGNAGAAQPTAVFLPLELPAPAAARDDDPPNFTVIDQGDGLDRDDEEHPF